MFTSIIEDLLGAKCNEISQSLFYDEYRSNKIASFSERRVIGKTKSIIISGLCPVLQHSFWLVSFDGNLTQQ